MRSEEGDGGFVCQVFNQHTHQRLTADEGGIAIANEDGLR